MHVHNHSLTCVEVFLKQRLEEQTHTFGFDQGAASVASFFVGIEAEAAPLLSVTQETSAGVQLMTHRAPFSRFCIFGSSSQTPANKNVSAAIKTILVNVYIFFFSSLKPVLNSITYFVRQEVFKRNAANQHLFYPITMVHSFHRGNRLMSLVYNVNTRICSHFLVIEPHIAFKTMI